MALTARVAIEPMRLEDVPAVHEIERLSFSTPWPAYAFEQELKSNRLARYVVARAGDLVAGFAGLWLMVDEAHITTFSVHPDWRRQGIGRQLLLSLADIAIAISARRMTLEVRVSNEAAQVLYRSLRLRGDRPPAALLHRRPRGRAGHDDARARRARPCGSCWPTSARARHR